MLEVLKRVSLILALLLLFTAFAGAAGQTEKKGVQSATTLAPVVLKGIMVGDADPLCAESVAMANKLIANKINATIDLVYLPWADWTSTYPLAFASGEPFDFAYAGNWAFYPQIAVKHGYLEITHDMLSKYAPDVLKDMPEAAWKQAKVNGKVYMIPTTFDEYVFSQIIVRGDLRKKYGLPPIKSWDDLGNFLAAVKQNEPAMIPFAQYGNALYTPWLLWSEQELSFAVGNDSNPVLFFRCTDPGDTIYNVYAMPQFKDFVKRMYEWQEAGYWSKNALSDKTLSTDLFNNGQVAALCHNSGNANALFITSHEKHPDWDVEVYDGSFGKKVMATPFVGSGFAIHATSKNVERALMLANLVRSDKDLNQLLCYGIKGVDWNPAGEKLATYLTRPNGSRFSGDCSTWIFRNSTFQMQSTNGSPMIAALYKDYATRTVTHPLQTLNFDDSAVKNEMAAFNQIYAQYVVPLVMGFVEPDKGVDELNKKLKEAGMDKILAEAQKQADEAMKTYSQPVW